MIDREKIKFLIETEMTRYIVDRPKSRALYEKAKDHLLAGVPMSWMSRWAGAFPIFVKQAKGAHLIDVDGHRYLDLCLGDTGSMLGHSPKAIVSAIKNQVQNGITFLLPTEDSIWLGEELARRFGLHFWQIYMSATDANRFAIRISRQVTGRNLILIFDGAYHGNVDEALVHIGGSAVGHGAIIIGQLPDPQLTTKVVQFNDIKAMEAALSSRDVACVLCEPAMTNTGIIFPDEGYHEQLRKITRKYGTLLIIDETHTICAGHKGLTGLWNLEPDLFTLGKAVAGGLPAAILGMSRDVEKRLLASTVLGLGIGGTLSGNALQVAALKASLQHVLNESNFTRMLDNAKRLADGISSIIQKAGLQWHAIRLGCRVEYCFAPTPPRNAFNARSAFDNELDKLPHLYMLNRGILLTPFHSMLLLSTAITARDVDFHNKVFAEFIHAIL